MHEIRRRKSHRINAREMALFMTPPLLHRPGASAFTLIELLVVIAVMAILISASGPLMQVLRGADQAGSDLSAALSLARVYAIANHTYVRVGFSQTAVATGQLPSTVVVFLYSADCDLDAAAATDMANAAEWPALARTLVLRNLLVYSNLNGTTPNTSGDAYPAQTTIPQFSRQVPTGSGPASSLKFSACIQFNPNGEAEIDTTTPTTARYIKIPIDQPQSPGNLQAPRDQDPCIVRLSGVNGNLTVLRKGEGI